jgi:hypothetical protein
MDDLPQIIRAELDAANARRINVIDGPTGSRIEFWATARGVVLAKLYPDSGGFEMFRPFGDDNDLAALLDALRAYLAPAS